MAQTDPAAFYTSDDPMEVLEAYCLIVGKKGETGLSKGKVKHWLIDYTGYDGYYPEGPFGKEIFGAPDHWGHVDANCYVHPKIVPLIAKTLGWKEEEVWAVAQFESGYTWDEIAPLEFQDDALAGYSGPEILLRELGTTDPLVRLRPLGLKNTDLVFTKIPIPPTSMRPRPEQTDQTDPLNFCLQSLIYYSSLYEYVERKEDRRWLDLQVQRHFSGLIQAFDSPGDFSLLHSALSLEVPEVEWEDGSSPIQDPEKPDPAPQALAFLDQDRLMVLNGTEISIRNPTTLETIRTFRIPLSYFAGLIPGREVVLLVNYEQMGQLDLNTGEWIGRFLPGIDYVLSEEASESSILTDWRTGHRLRLWTVFDYPVIAAHSPDRRHVWMQDKEGNGGIYEVKTGLPVFLTHTMRFWEEAPFLAGQVDEEKVKYGWGNALGRFQDGWLMFANNTLYYRHKPVFALDWAVNAACFDKTGTRLFVGGEGKGCLIDLEKGLLSGNLADFRVQCHDW